VVKNKNEMNNPIAKWHEAVETKNMSILDEILAEDVTFHSPVVFKPIQGKAMTQLYLGAASVVLDNEHFKYVKEIIGERSAALEFTTEIEGVFIDGLDLIEWNESGKMTEFKVFIRPLQAVNKLHEKMMAMLEQMK